MKTSCAVVSSFASKFTKLRQEDLLEHLVSFKSHSQNTVPVTALHRWTFHIVIRDVKRNSDPEVLRVNNKLATYISSSY